MRLAPSSRWVSSASARQSSSLPRKARRPYRARPDGKRSAVEPLRRVLEIRCRAYRVGWFACAARPTDTRAQDRAYRRVLRVRRARLCAGHCLVFAKNERGNHDARLVGSVHGGVAFRPDAQAVRSGSALRLEGSPVRRLRIPCGRRRGLRRLRNGESVGEAEGRLEAARNGEAHRGVLILSYDYSGIEGRWRRVERKPLSEAAATVERDGSHEPHANGSRRKGRTC